MNIKQRVQIAIETKNFITTKRDHKFYQAVAERFKLWTMWFPGCTVHHWDENHCNNHPLNLGCMTSAEHTILHHKGIIRLNKNKSRPISISKIKPIIEIDNILYTVTHAALIFDINPGSLRTAIYEGRTSCKDLEFKVIKNDWYWKIDGYNRETKIRDRILAEGYPSRSY